MISCQLIEEVDAFLALEHDWVDLLGRTSQNVFFWSWGWVSNWVAQFSSQFDLNIIAAYEEERLVGIAPLCRHSRRFGRLLPYSELSFIGSGIAAADHLDFIAEAGREREICQSMRQFILTELGNFDFLTLEGLAQNAVIGNLVKESDAESVERQLEPCPYILLPDSWESFLAGVSRNLRQNWRRKTRRLIEKNEGESPYQIAKSDAEADAGMENLFRLHQMARNKQGDAGSFSDAPMRRFHRQVARQAFAQGGLRLYSLLIHPHNTAAVIYAIRNGKKLLYYATGYDPAWGTFSPGRQLFGFMIQQAIEEGLAEIDLLRGEEAYKYDWTDLVRNDVNLRMPASIRGKLIASARRAKSNQA